MPGKRFASVYMPAGIILAGCMLLVFLQLPLILSLLISAACVFSAIYVFMRMQRGREILERNIATLGNLISQSDTGSKAPEISIVSENESINQLITSINLLCGKFKKNIHKIEDNMQIGHALALEKNHYRLFHTILYYCKKLTGADAGSIFIVENNGKKNILRFKYTHTFSKNCPYEEFTMPMDSNSIAGYVAVTGQTVNIPDVYKIDKSSPYSFNRKFDVDNAYMTRSMLVVPMRDHVNKVIGVIQLINCKEDPAKYTGNEAYEIILNDDNDLNTYVTPFSREAENLTLSVAGEAAIALENIQMINQIRRQFEAFVKASVTAIESRDPATSGHSFRVAEMSMRIAESISNCTTGNFSNIFFSETDLKALEYAAMVHDFGKIYIDPGIFLKGKKLFHKDFELLKLRLFMIKVLLTNRYLEEQKKADRDLLKILEDEYKSKEESLDIIYEMLTQLNDPNTKIDDIDNALDGIIDMSKNLDCIGPNGRPVPVLTDDEIINLRIKNGSLNPVERKIIESHVNYSYTFVSQIPWPEEFAKIPEIVLCHHEFLDGTGYPNGKRGKKSIPIEARIITIADIYDALIAADRPYKKALPLETVLKILQEEGKNGRLDNNIIDLFIADKIWQKVTQ
ncbi:MAG: GAF domain-containing protein [Spirochaetales bacterium]|nr:GAF domain-containing protein [Spirochaetales bacterium]